MDHGENNITVVDEEGNEQLCEVLFTFDSEQFGKSYVLYYPIGADENDEEEIEIHASAFVPSDDDKDGELKPIETDEEWDLIEEMLNTFLEENDEE
ncbi:uncharacterized protein YrzB (UPF0473 family) [Cytobacillus horneckiae]|uniref:UPF0473 protein CWS20_09520 n=1 Tax=Cytobacillus horneckiae TaxID=549687 RepID=A0A2N0ZIA6_9BACI|nr:DUF1292 domain-containing protein [Cytobacillus horneckiae]MBN6887796.1 DUF1292 domain-containing protein [Cytobacillus horneckiae]MCM3179848.1 DUF1292 domain-containing protein [Cytobacillus horneckiae]MEC1155237.1 DUF1292 domain-containing protein [Cytobacillus horneckiae]MED2936710.1 DUF1292 domain-containing protein [Cytobacillus horneckiae]PKG29221.1 DUF1292 domain-containing protein [Cytobacillus horneckiae]